MIARAACDDDDVVVSSSTRAGGAGPAATTIGAAIAGPSTRAGGAGPAPTTIGAAIAGPAPTTIGAIAAPTPTTMAAPIALLLALLLACSAACASTAPPEWATPLVDDVKRASFPELAHEPLKICLEGEQYVGGRALFAPSSLWGEAFPRDYSVCFNPEVTGEDRRRYVAAHELAHIVDYASRETTRELVAFLAEIAATPWFSERRADVIVIEKGYVDELVAYRKWQREWMRDAPDALAARRKNYFTPNEARAADEVRRRCPKVFATFREKPPRDLREILVRCL